MQPVNQRKGKQEGKKCVLAYGEVTGHSHRFENLGTAELDGSKLTVLTKDDLVHEEHAAHTLQPGEGIVTIQMEYTQGSLRDATD